MDNSTRMQMAQSRGAGMGTPEEAPAGEMAEPGMAAGGSPDAEAMLPQIAQALGQLAQALPPDKQQVVLECAQRLQAVSGADSSNSGGMPQDEAEAYGEPTVGQ